LAPATLERGKRIAPLGDAVQRYLAAAGLGQRRKDAAIYAAWDEAVGPDLAVTARATGFSKGQLVVEVASSALLQELVGFTGEGFKQRANSILDRPHIRRVTFRLRRRT
jgi:hypothetical protein